jgi:hypothetical protein
MLDGGCGTLAFEAFDRRQPSDSNSLELELTLSQLRSESALSQTEPESCK